jgi:uncharacterized protein YprB with RNaseH-like and TPR domain
MKIVAWDLETSDLKALMGRMFCCSFCPIVPGQPHKPYTFRLDDPKYRGHGLTDDSKLALAVARELEQYNMIVGWNSKLFDLPFLNARLTKSKQQAALCRPQFHLDLMYYAGGCSLRIGSKKLDNVQRFLRLSTAKTPIEWDDWSAVASGDKASMNRVVQHCEADVKVLAEAYWRLLPNVANIHR